jgi:hypothetical protein
MAHFAEINDDNIVVRVIVADDKEWCENNLGGAWVQTSYNTCAGEHTQGGVPLHKNYAGIGMIFDGTGFHSPQPYSSWTLNNDTYLWEAPTPRPEGLNWNWNEENQEWVEITVSE